MKRALLFLLLCCTVFTLRAQFTLGVQGQGFLNTAPFFGDFSNAYNTLFDSTLSKKMGNPKLGAGYSIELGYKILKMSMSLRNSRFSSQTHATFTNGAKRKIQYNYRFWNVNIGYFYPGENNQLIIEAGLTACRSTVDSYVILPNKEVDYFAGGLSSQQSWINIGGNFRLALHHRITDYFWLTLDAGYTIVNNNSEAAPRIRLGQTAATHTFRAFSLGVGFVVQFGEYID
jgi:hypothetical protein